MVNRLAHGAAGGDFNSIISPIDSVKNPQIKMSPSCRNLVQAFEWSDSYRKLHPGTIQFSRYQGGDGDGATRLDRSYHWGDLEAAECQYHSISFSDHLSLRVSYILPNFLARNLAPQIKPTFKIPPSVVDDETFKQQLKDSMADWLQVKEAGADLMLWWDAIVKGGIKYLAVQRGKELKKEKIGKLNILKLKQA